MAGTDVEEYEEDNENKISEIFGLHLAYTLSNFAGDFRQENSSFAEAKVLKKAYAVLEPFDVIYCCVRAKVIKRRYGGRSFLPFSDSGHTWCVSLNDHE